MAPINGELSKDAPDIEVWLVYLIISFQESWRRELLTYDYYLIPVSEHFGIEPKSEPCREFSTECTNEN